MRLLSILLLLLTLPLHAADLTVVTFNIRYDNGGDKGARDWDTRRDLVVETIRKMNPDVLGLQEALAHQIDFLAKQLPDYKWIGLGRDDGKKKGEYCAIFYRTKRLTLDKENHGTFWLSDSPDAPGSITWDNVCTRIATWAVFTDQTTKKKFCLYNTHWDHRGQDSRVKSADLLFKHSAKPRAAMPTIIMGDFNATPTNPAIAKLLRVDPNDSAPLTLSLLKLHPNEKNSRTGHGYSGKKDGAAIDHVFITPQWKLKKAWIDYHQRDNILPSDHYPVAAVLELPK